MTNIIKLIKKIIDDDLFSLAAQFSYYIILAIFPFIILVISIFGRHSEYLFYALDSIDGIIPSNVHNVISNILTNASTDYNKPYLSASIIGILWSASSGSVGIIKGINKAYNCSLDKNFIFLRLKGIFFTISLMLSVQLIFILIVTGDYIINFIQTLNLFPDVSYFIINVIRYGISIIYIFIICFLAFKYLPSKKRTFSFVLPGAVFSTCGFIISSVIFSAYTTTRVDYYTNIYGNLSDFFILILWIYITSVIFLLGAEINVFANNKN